MIFIKKYYDFFAFVSILCYLFDKRYKIGIENCTGMDETKKIKWSTSGYSIPSVKNFDLPLREYCTKHLIIVLYQEIK